MPAQGNALGYSQAKFQALKGRNIVPPLQGWAPVDANTQGVALGWFVAGPLALKARPLGECVTRFTAAYEQR